MDANKAIKQNKAKKDDTTQTVVVQNRYSIEIPSFLKPSSKYKEDASLNYLNKTLDCGVMVIEDTKSDFDAMYETLKNQDYDSDTEKSMLEYFSTLFVGNMFDLEKNEADIDNWVETTVNGLNAIMMEAFQKRTFFKDAAHYRLGFIEGRDTIYTICVTVGGSSISKIGDKFEGVIESFIEL